MFLSIILLNIHFNLDSGSLMSIINSGSLMSIIIVYAKNDKKIGIGIIVGVVLYALIMLFM